MIRRIAALAVALSMNALAAACTGPAEPSPTPTPSPTFACIPEAGGEPVPCGPIEYEQAQKRDKLYADAEAVYRRYWAELNLQTGADKPAFTDVLAETTTGVFQDDARVAVDPERRYRRVSGQADLVRVGRLPGLSRAGSTVALLVCIDASKGRYLAPGTTTPSSGTSYEMRVYLAPVEGALRLADAESRDVATC